MKVSTAIPILQHPQLFVTQPLSRKQQDALNLSISALIRLDTARKRSTRSVHALLPGETPEGA